MQYDYIPAGFCTRMTVLYVKAIDNVLLGNMITVSTNKVRNSGVMQRGVYDHKSIEEVRRVRLKNCFARGII